MCKKTVLRIVTVLWIGFIFWNSLHVAAASDEMSSSLLDVLRRFPLLHALTNHIVRKSAHFIEFFLLGGLLTASLRPEREWVRGAAAMPLFFSLFIPLVDETIQLFVPGRSGQVSDVLLDFSGALCGVLFVSALLHRFAPLCAVPPHRWSRKQAAALAVLTLLCLGVLWTGERPAGFVVLGVLLTAWAFVLLGRTREALVSAAFGGLLAAVLGEGIQLLTACGTARVRDVWLDLGGVLAGGILCAAFVAARRTAGRE